jgi:hypothetical protein
LILSLREETARSSRIIKLYIICPVHKKLLIYYY